MSQYLIEYKAKKFERRIADGQVGKHIMTHKNKFQPKRSIDTHRKQETNLTWKK